MKKREFEIDKLARARELQDEMAALHIPTPVMSWEFEVRDKYGNITEKGVGKSNSFTRNALNTLAYYVGLCATILNTKGSFGDGFLGHKNTAGTNLMFGSSTSSSSLGRFPGYNPALYVGTGTTETLDDYALPGYDCVTSIGTSFNATTRKLINVISGAYLNSTGSTLNITEAGVRTLVASGNYILSIHDIFDAVVLAPGNTIAWTYAIEIAYPNP